VADVLGGANLNVPYPPGEMADSWETDWAELDRRTRGRLRRAAYWGRAVADPREAALVAAFARSKADSGPWLQILGHFLIIACVLVALYVNVETKGGDLAPLYGVLLLLNAASIGVQLTSGGRLVKSAERNERVAAGGRAGAARESR
jgi:hypothetical protein